MVHCRFVSISGFAMTLVHLHVIMLNWSTMGCHIKLITTTRVDMVGHVTPRAVNQHDFLQRVASYVQSLWVCSTPVVGPKWRWCVMFWSHSHSIVSHSLQCCKCAWTTFNVWHVDETSVVRCTFNNTFNHTCYSHVFSYTVYLHFWLHF